MTILLRLALAAPLALAAYGAPTLAANAAPAVSSEQDAPAAKTDTDPHKKVCRNLKITGSRLAVRRVCATAMEWDAHDREAAKMAEDMAASAKRGPAGPQ
jgi:hypothetical protein